MPSAMVFCDKLASLDLIKKIRSKFPIFVASNDIEVQRNAISIKGVAGVCFVDQKVPFWDVANDVKSIIQQIDIWLSSLSDNISDEILYWGFHLEGGSTNQRVQEALILIKSYIQLEKDFEVAEIHVLANRFCNWEIRLLQEYSKSRNIPISFYGKPSVYDLCACVRKFSFPIFKSFCLMFREIATRLSSLGLDKKKHLDGDVIFQICSPDSKHLLNVEPLINSLACLGVKSLLLYFGRRRGVVEIFKNKKSTSHQILTIDLESYLTGWAVLKSLYQSGVVLLMSIINYRKISKVSFRGVDISPILSESIAIFCLVDLPRRIRYADMLAAFFLSNLSASAVKLWGAGQIFEGRYLYYYLKANKKKYLKFHYNLGAVSRDWPYFDRNYAPDLFIAKSHQEASAFKNFAFDLGHVEIAISGDLRCSDQFMLANNEIFYRNKLGLPSDGAIYIGLDPGSGIRGYNSPVEQMELLESVLLIAKDQPKSIVVIKPHPSYKIDNYKLFIQSFNCNSNIFVMDSNISSSEFIGSVDVFISKYSTMLIQAVQLGRCAISAILHADDRFKVYGNIPYVIKDKTELFNLLTSLARDYGYFTQWRGANLKRQSDLLNAQMSALKGLPKTSNILASRILKNEIS